MYIQYTRIVPVKKIVYYPSNTIFVIVGSFRFNVCHTVYTLYNTCIMIIVIIYIIYVIHTIVYYLFHLYSL